MLALALYDYINDAHEAHSYQQQQQQQQHQQLISFQRGTVLDVLQSNGGWSYGRIVQKPINENPFTSSSNDSIGWFPTSYVSHFDGPSTTAFSSVDSVSKVTNSEPKASAVVPDHTETSEDDDGFYGTPMGGYIDPQDEADDSNNNTQRSNTNDDRDLEVLPPGVTSMPVPHRRQLRVVTIPKNIVNNIATTTVKVTNRLHRRENRSSTTITSPAVYVSPP